MREHLRAGLDELRRLGLTGRIEHGGKHARLVFLVRGALVRVGVGCTPRSNGTAAKFLRRDIRRAVGRTA